MSPTPPASPEPPQPDKPQPGGTPSGDELPAQSGEETPAAGTPPGAALPRRLKTDEIIVVDDSVDAEEADRQDPLVSVKKNSDAVKSSDRVARKTMLEARNVHKYYGEKKVLVDIDVKVQQRQTLCVIGGSGCGKSTLLRVLCGLTPPEDLPDTAVLVNNQNIFTANREEMESIRGRLGMVFQYAALLASYTVFENVALPLLERGKMARSEIKDRVADVLEKVHLPGTEGMMPAELSGGMRKRVGIARAIVTQPDVILFDEPTSGLDPVMTANFDQLVLELRETLQLTSVIVSHDLQSVYRIADRVLMLHGGQKIFDDTTEAFRASEIPEVRQFVRGEPSGPEAMV